MKCADLNDSFPLLIRVVIKNNWFLFMFLIIGHCRFYSSQRTYVRSMLYSKRILLLKPIFRGRPTQATKMFYLCDTSMCFLLFFIFLILFPIIFTFCIAPYASTMRDLLKRFKNNSYNREQKLIH